MSYDTLSGALTITPEQDPSQDPSCFLVFNGVGLTQDGLQDWLRLCAKQVVMPSTLRLYCHVYCGSAMFSDHSRGPYSPSRHLGSKR